MSGKKVAFLACAVVGFLIIMLLMATGGGENKYTPEDVEASFMNTLTTNNINMEFIEAFEDDHGNIQYLYKLDWGTALSFSVVDGELEYICIAGPDRNYVDCMLMFLEINDDIFQEELGRYAPSYSMEDGIIFCEIDLR